MADPDLKEQPLEINEGFVGEWSAILFVGARSTEPKRKRNAFHF